LRAQLDPREWELLQRYGQRGGRRPLSDPEPTGRVSLSSCGLSNNEINRCLTRLRAIFAFANDVYDLSLKDPTRRRFLPRSDPPCTWLRPDQFQALIDAAAELDASPARGAYAHRGRTSAILVLGLAGPRVAELCGARWRDVWPTATGSKRDRNSVRNRLLAPSSRAPTRCSSSAAIDPCHPRPADGAGP
jgi:integrase